MNPVVVLVHVPNVDTALQWYLLSFEKSVLDRHESGLLAVLSISGFSIEIVRADDKVSNGKCGSVLYWSVSNFDTTLSKLIGIGAKLYRGPITIENGASMCQVEDPFGNLIGLRG